MRQNGQSPETFSDIARYFNQASSPSQQETLGSVVVEILRAGNSLSRKAICSKLLRRLEQASTPEEEQHLHELISMLFRRED
ncbi:two-component-system connector protein YcgZ [Pantoea deleyi]|uniref:Two-component-system connector protein YcgZ n=1 Tax=Pantoea deleyi TaxID=470932 RepID=A0A506QHG0_9GAMM|nr:regulatory protein YcgZ [Pantoea deleyi]ORM84124.1 two-component-system connector protein YcgZ [Pantoea deleyi]TPV45643.1 two-component-system connector protein YcgZ [Pantoea deleyi]